MSIATETHTSASCDAGRWRQHLLGLVLLALVPGYFLVLPLLPSTSAAPPVELPFLEGRSEDHILAYFGYPGCSDICPMSLRRLSSTRKHLIEQGHTAEVGILFVNVQLDTPDEVTLAYAKAHDPAFTGYSLRGKDRKALYNALSAKGYADGDDPASHTGFIYWFNREGQDWYLNRIFLELPGKGELASVVAGETI